MDRRFLRFLFIVEFLVCLAAVFIVWPQVGGQMHLDLIQWHWKLLLGALFAFAVVRATIVACAADQPWNARVFSWFLVMAILAVIMGMLTYDAHINEPQDDPDLHLEDPQPRNL